MKQIINGRKYDTDTAQCIDGYSPSGYGRNDYSWFEEDLYRKRTGEFFLHGSGNAASRYGEYFGQSGRQSGSKIVPLTIDEAKRWIEEHSTVETYERIFGEVAE